MITLVIKCDNCKMEKEFRLDNIDPEEKEVFRILSNRGEWKCGERIKINHHICGCVYDIDIIVNIIYN